MQPDSRVIEFTMHGMEVRFGGWPGCACSLGTGPLGRHLVASERRC
jgi:hypothetical protein